MNNYDIFLIAVVLVSTLMGLWKGLVREIFSLAGVVLGVVVALVGGPTLARSLSGVIPSESAAYAAAFLILFLAVLFLGSLLGAFLHKILDLAKLGIPNRVLGGFFGLARGILTAIVITLGLTLFLEEDSRLLSESRVVPHLAFATRSLAPLLPASVEDVLLERLGDLPAGGERALGGI